MALVESSIVLRTGPWLNSGCEQCAIQLHGWEAGTNAASICYADEVTVTETSTTICRFRFPKSDGAPWLEFECSSSRECARE
jgi:hypothetical protein